MTIRSTASPKNITSDTDITLNAGSGNKTIFVPSLWDDIQFSISGARVPAANAPTWAAFTANTNLYTFAVDDYIDLEVQEVLHSYEEGTDLSIHLHYYNNVLDGTDRTVKYIIYYTITTPNGVAVEGNVSEQLTIPANTTDITHLIDGIGADVSGAGLKIGTAIGMRIKRVVEDSGTAPTNPPFLGMVGVHFLKNTIGSSQVATK